MKLLLVLVLLLPMSASTAETGDNTNEIEAEAVFEALKDGLVGEWTGEISHSGEPVEATFYLTGNESAIVEHIRRPQKPAASMSTVYHLADEHLQLTHYCSFMNQPRLRAASVSADGKTINFGILDVSNLSRSGNRYTYKMRISFPEKDKASVTYVGLDDDIESGELTVELTRAE